MGHLIDTFTPLPNKQYNIIYADPPWAYKDNTCRGSAAKHYPTLSLQEICSLPITEISAPDSILFLWATYPQLSEALTVIKAWGFTYKTLGFQWLKTNKTNKDFFFGVGRWTRSNTEACLLATKGKPQRINKAISQLIIADRRAHSQKPDEVREQIVSLVGDLPRIELFARTKGVGWDTWGLESEIERKVYNAQ